MSPSGSKHGGMEGAATASTLSQCAQQLKENESEIQEAESRMQALLRRQGALVHAQRILQHRHLVHVLKDTALGFTPSSGRPVAAIIVHRCLLQWHALSVTDSATQAFLHSLITVVTQALDEDQLMRAASGFSSGGGGGGGGLSQGASGHLSGALASTAAAAAGGQDASSSRERGEGRDVLVLCAYWLTVTSTLLALLHRQVPEHASYLAHHHKGGPPASAAAAGARRPSHQGGQLFSTSSTATTGGGADADGHGHAAAAAVAAKQIADKLANTFSNFGRSLLRRAPHGEGAGGGGGAAPGAAAVVVAQQHAQHGDKQLQQQAGGSGAHTPPHQHSHAGPLAAGTLLPEGMEPTPAQVFRHSLDLLLLQAYASCRDTIKKSLAHLLPACIQAPPPPPSSPPAAPRRASADGAASGFGKEAAAVRQAPVDPGARFTLDEEETGDGDDDEGQGGAAGPGGEREAAAEGGAEGGREAADALTQEAVEAVEQVVADALKAPGPLRAWEELVAALQDALQLLRSQHVPRILVKCVFKQLLAFVDAQLFNQLLLRPDCCCASNARHVLSGLKLLDTWVVAGSADAMMKPLYAELRHVRQAATFLMTPYKSQLSLEDITGSLCPALTAQQIYRLCTTYWDDASNAATAEPDAPLAAPAPIHTRATPTAHSSAQPSPFPGATPTAARATPTAGAGAPLIDLASGGEDAAAAAAAGEPPAAQQQQGAEQGGKEGGGGEEEDGGLVLVQPPSPVHAALPARASAASGPAVADLISGEVLEALKEGSGAAGGGVQTNGGLIVTFLLDDTSAPIIAPDGFTAPEVLTLIEGKDLFAPLELPARHFDTDACPKEAFAFVEEPPPVPPHLANK